MSFVFHFNRRRQWVQVYLEDVHPTTFQRKGGGRWGYYVAAAERRPRSGLFGEIHLVSSRVRPDVVIHELHHLWIDWLKAGGIVFTDANEERLVELYDEMYRHFWREYGKL